MAKVTGIYDTFWLPMALITEWKAGSFMATAELTTEERLKQLLSCNNWEEHSGEDKKKMGIREDCLAFTKIFADGSGHVLWIPLIVVKAMELSFEEGLSQLNESGWFEYGGDKTMFWMRRRL